METLYWLNFCMSLWLYSRSNRQPNTANTFRLTKASMSPHILTKIWVFKLALNKKYLTHGLCMPLQHSEMIFLQLYLDLKLDCFLCFFKQRFHATCSRYVMTLVHPLIYMIWYIVIDQAWGEDIWIFMLAEFFYCVFKDRDGVEIHKLAKKEPG